jgi:hypothetical protein
MFQNGTGAKTGMSGGREWRVWEANGRVDHRSGYPILGFAPLASSTENRQDRNGWDDRKRARTRS